MSSFLTAYGHVRLADLLGDDSQVPVDDALCQWLELPPEALVRFLEERPGRISAPALLLDDSVFVPDIQRQKATYSLTQVPGCGSLHRL